jgi:hypothetical protein
VVELSHDIGASQIRKLIQLPLLQERAGVRLQVRL